MAKQPLNGVLQHLRKVAAVHTSRELPDRELLERFVSARDEASFTVLIERHAGVPEDAKHANEVDAAVPAAAVEEPLARDGAPVAQAPVQFADREGEAIESLAFSHDSRNLVGGGQGKALRFWDIKTKEAWWNIKGLKGIVRQVAFSPDGKTVAAGIDGGTIRLWNIATGIRLARPPSLNQRRARLP